MVALKGHRKQLQRFLCNANICKDVCICKDICAAQISAKKFAMIIICDITRYDVRCPFRATIQMRSPVCKN